MSNIQNESEFQPYKETLHKWLKNETMSPTDIQFTCMSAREKLSKISDGLDLVMKNLGEVEDLMHKIITRDGCDPYAAENAGIALERLKEIRSAQKP